MKSDAGRCRGGSTVIVVAVLLVLAMLSQTLVRSRFVVRHVAKSSLHEYQTELVLEAARRQAENLLSTRQDEGGTPPPFRWRWVPPEDSGLAMRTATAWSEPNASGGVMLRVRCDFGRYEICRHRQIAGLSNNSSARERLSDE